MGGAAVAVNGLLGQGVARMACKYNMCGTERLGMSETGEQERE